MVRIRIGLALFALASSLLVLAGPARAQDGYCAETFDRIGGLGRTEDDPVGDCRLLEEFRIRH